MVYDTKAWCHCGHAMEIVRPGKHQKVGCCEYAAELEEAVRAAVRQAEEDEVTFGGLDRLTELLKRRRHI